MKITILRGQQNSGKTTTIGLLYSELLKISEKEHLFNKKHVSKNILQFEHNGELYDFVTVLTIKKLE